ncbi:cytochrome P450 [Streptomyces sp. NBRC 109706]|uniref:cytochrome P450 n=1 Tax=Streptomyces sp. NBRC 109706 TaxID=1550035 RepID=UPI000783C01C|nr:cytochrome P450 [Streptomyces sp. NBRC 109706]
MDASKRGPAESPADTGENEQAGKDLAAEAAAAGCPVDHTALATAGSAKSAEAEAPAAEPAKAKAAKAAKAVAEEPAQAAAPAPIPAESLPGPKTPALMQIVKYWKDPATFVERCREEYGSRFALRIRIPPKPLYVLSDPDEIKQMFLAPADVLHTGTGSSTIEKFTGQSGLAWLDEDDHKKRRKLLMPSFHGKALQRVDTAIDEMAVEDVAKWPRGESMALHPHIHRFTLHVIREVIFGKVSPKIWDELLEVLIGMMRFNNRMGSAMMIHKMPSAAVKLLTAIRPLGLHQFLKLRERADALIAEAVAERREVGDLGDDMLSVLLGITHEDGSPLTIREMRDEMMTIFLAGTETTAAAIAWGFEYLSREHAARERLVEEIDKGEEDTFLTATVHEVLRLRPSIPQIIPRTVMKPIEIGGVRYEPGMLLWASAYLMNRHPSLYDEPDAFRPERFLGTKPGVYTWIPFGGGRIRCLGDKIALLEMKAMFREVLSTCELHRTDMTPEATRSRSVSTLPEHGTRLELRARDRKVSLAGS